MRILIVNDTHYPQVNGASYFSQRLAHYLKIRGHKIAVIAPSESFKHTKKTIDDLPVYGIRSSQFLFKNDVKFRYCFPFFNKKYIQQILDEFKPDIVHIQSQFAVCRNTINVSLKNKIKVVGTNHFMPENLIHYLPFGKKITNYIKEILWNDFARVFNKLNDVTSPTETAAKLIRHRIKKPIKVISNGIDLKRFHPDEKNNPLNPLRKLFSIPNKPTFLYVGRLDREKYLDIVLKAIAKVREQQDIHMVIAGNGIERDKLKDLTKKLKIEDNVTFTGFVPDKDLPHLYNVADCFVIAGTEELQSLVTMEAMASGLPVIGVNAMALPELVHDNKNGFQFEPGNIDELSTKMLKFLADKALQKKMSDESLRIIQHHDIEKTIDQFEKIYTDQNI